MIKICVAGRKFNFKKPLESIGKCTTKKNCVHDKKFTQDCRTIRTKIDYIIDSGKEKFCRFFDVKISSYPQVMSSAIVFSAFLAFPLMYMRLHGFLNEFRNSSAITDHELYRNLKFNSPEKPLNIELKGL